MADGKPTYAELESALAEERRRRAVAEAELAVVKRNQRLTRGRVVPAGDEDAGYGCPVCCAPVRDPWEQSFCGGCGVELNWHPEPGEPDVAPGGRAA